MNEHYPHLPNAPIKEAVVDIQVMEPWPVADLYNGPIAGFKEPVDMFVAEFHIQHEQGEVKHGTSRAHGGYRYESEDGRFIVQIRQQGLVVSRLAPYSYWSELISVAQRVWEMSFALGGAPIGRLAVRYINVLTVPFPETDVINFDQYLNNAPRIPTALNQGLKNFLTRLVIETSVVPEGTAIINQTFEQNEADTLSLILDIDVFRAFDATAPTGEAMWQFLELLRNEKNKIFFNTMTSEALELCQ
jgi:uncharacterized protein (TIGR04255 family)